jgi:hypothetical protein
MEVEVPPQHLGAGKLGTKQKTRSEGKYNEKSK